MSSAFDVLSNLPRDESPEVLIAEIKDLLARIDEGHATPETGLARVIERLAKGNPYFFNTVLDDCGFSRECHCWDR